MPKVYTNWDLEKYNIGPMVTLPENSSGVMPVPSERENYLQKKMDELINSVQPGVKHTRAESAIAAAGVVKSELDALRGGRQEQYKSGLEQVTGMANIEEKRKNRLAEMDKLGLETRKMYGTERYQEGMLGNMAKQIEETAKGREASILQSQAKEKGLMQRQIMENKYKAMTDSDIKKVLSNLSTDDRQKIFDYIDSIYGNTGSNPVGSNPVESTPTSPTEDPFGWRK